MARVIMAQGTGLQVLDGLIDQLVDACQIDGCVVLAMAGGDILLSASGSSDPELRAMLSEMSDSLSTILLKHRPHAVLIRDEQDGEQKMGTA